MSPLVDLTMQVDESTPQTTSLHAGTEGSDEDNHIIDQEQIAGLAGSGHLRGHPSRTSSHTEPPRDDDTELRTRPNSLVDAEGVTSSVPEGSATSSAGGYIKRKTSQLLSTFSSQSTKAEAPLSPLLASLVQGYASSQIARDIRADIDQATQNLATNGEPDPAAESSRDVVEESVSVRGRRRASYATQFRILSGRAFKNLYRNPALLTAHYISSVVIACKCTVLTFHSLKCLTHLLGLCKCSAVSFSETFRKSTHSLAISYPFPLTFKSPTGMISPASKTDWAYSFSLWLFSAFRVFRVWGSSLGRGSCSSGSGKHQTTKTKRMPTAN